MWGAITARLADPTGHVLATWLRAGHSGPKLAIGRRVAVSGTIVSYGRQVVFENPDWEFADSEPLHTRRLVPVYPLTSGLHAYWLRGLIREVVVAAAPAFAAYTIRLNNGTSFTTRYEPEDASWDDSKVVFLDEVGTLISISKSEIAGIESDFETKGYGRMIDTTTMELGWAPNDAAEGVEGGAPADPLAQMQQESGQMTTRIADKEANLVQLENQRTALTAERAKLMADLDNKDVTLNQLQAGLERLKQENRRLRAETAQQQQDKQRVDADIQKLQAEINRVEADDRGSDQAKKEKIESLKKQIRAYLQIMMAQ